MGYRRKGKELKNINDEWLQWCKENTDLIETSGIPHLVIESQEHWGDFLDHGILDHHFDPLNFSVDELSIKQKVALLRLIMKYPIYLNSVVASRLISSLMDFVDDFFKD